PNRSPGRGRPYRLRHTSRSCSLLDRDGELGAVRHGETGLVDELGRHLAVTDLVGLAVVVDVEQLRRQRVAAVVSLALLGIDVDSHERTVSRRCETVPGSRLTGPVGSPG